MKTMRVLLMILPWVMAASALGQTTAALSPPTGAKEVCPDMPLRMTFAGVPTLGTGVIEIRSAEDDAILDSIELRPVPTMPGRSGPQGPATPAVQPIAGVSGIRVEGVMAKGSPLSPGMPTRAKMIGGMNFVTYPVMIFGKEVVIVPDKPLPYGKGVYVKVAPGVFQVNGAADPGITDSKGWQFTTRAAPPTPGAKRIVVAADGKGDFCTVQAAVESVPEGNKDPVTIFIRKGVYYEIVNFGQRDHLTFLGEDRKRTIIAYPNNNTFSTSMPQLPARDGITTRNGTSGSSYRRGLFQAQAVSDLTIVNLTLHNTTPQGGSQAEAIILNGTNNARAILTNVDLYSYQDTLQINGQAYISHCYIEGDVDFMWGKGPCYFDQCRATTVRNNAYYTQIRNTAANHGYVYNDCIFDGAPGIRGNFLSRIEPTRFPESEVVLLNCVLGPAVGDLAWRFDGAAPAPENVRFWEYASHKPTEEAVDTSKRFASSRQLKEPADSETIRNYSDPAWVLGGWNPKLAPIVTTQPKDVSLAAGQRAVLTVEVAAVPDATYQWQKDGKNITNATKPQLVLENVSDIDSGSYAAVVTNSAGTTASDIARVTVAK